MRSTASPCRSRGFRASSGCGWARSKPFSPHPCPLSLTGEGDERAMRSFFRSLPALISYLVPITVVGQQAALSPALSRPLPPDTVIALWFFGRAQTPLAQVADAVRQAGGSIRRESRWL